MAFAWLSSLFFLFLIAGLHEAADYSILDFEIANKFELWMAQYGKVYSDGAEKAKRFEIFKEKLKFVENFNSDKNRSYTVGINEFADLTTEEFTARYTGAKIPKTEFRKRVDVTKRLNQPVVPSSIDWRTKGAVTSVKHQGGCGCGWAFAAVATIESNVKIRKNVLYDLSVQQIVDCDSNGTHCNPGNISEAYEYTLYNGGLTTWANYPYTAFQGVCNLQKAKATVFASRLTYYEGGLGDEKALKVDVARQPVGVLINASTIEFQTYTSGIYRGPCNTSQDHAVTIVGYGEENSIKYWIVKNSWGDKWGESGYVRMEREVASPKGLCGIAGWPIYPSRGIHLHICTYIWVWIYVCVGVFLCSQAS